jgi:hypothetical protein
LDDTKLENILSELSVNPKSRLAPMPEYRGAARRDSSSEPEEVEEPRRRHGRKHHGGHHHHHQHRPKNLSVHFDPSQIRPSPPQQQQQQYRHYSPAVERRSSKGNSSRQRLDPLVRYGSLPRSSSYGRFPTGNDDFRRGGFDDDVCSSCSSSSSSDSDDPYAYQLPPGKAYGGVRVSYVPNDRTRAKLQKDKRREQQRLQSPSPYTRQLSRQTSQPASLNAGYQESLQERQQKAKDKNCIVS